MSGDEGDEEGHGYDVYKPMAKMNAMHGKKVKTSSLDVIICAGNSAKAWKTQVRVANVTVPEQLPSRPVQ